MSVTLLGFVARHVLFAFFADGGVTYGRGRKGERYRIGETDGPVLERVAGVLKLSKKTAVLQRIVSMTKLGICSSPKSHHQQAIGRTLLIQRNIATKWVQHRPCRYKFSCNSEMSSIRVGYLIMFARHLTRSVPALKTFGAGSCSPLTAGTCFPGFYSIPPYLHHIATDRRPAVLNHQCRIDRP